MIFHCLKILCAPPTHPRPHRALEITDLFTVSTVLLFPECHLFGIMQYVDFTDWLSSLRNMHLRFFHAISCLDSSCLFPTAYFP